MRNLEQKFKVINNKSGEVNFEFEGTKLDFVKLYTSEMDNIVDVGYPADIIADYRNAIINDSYDDNDIPAIEALIDRLSEFDKDDVVFVGSGKHNAIISTDLDSIDGDFTVHSEKLKEVIDVDLDYLIECVKDNNNSNRVNWLAWKDAEEIFNTYTESTDYTEYNITEDISSLLDDLQTVLENEQRLDKIVDRYIYHNSKDTLKELHNTVKNLSEKDLVKIEDRLIAKDIDLKKFESDLKESTPKSKLKM
ncbi:hypothetical protein LLJ53_11310 [Pseudomonas aeruginosa]|uniref:hypothetical protein n=1 Tax=Pseudomonas aeruginosa TaxID=287 RepID=UPI0021E42C57|nr:hypothetical protein [Pseudomonas aeruginosa]UYF86593.1 hypothetical protein LLJ53_11310 [Pseudomonas aeruginosa]